MRLYGVYMRLYGVYMAYYGVYSVGYTVMAYGIGLRDRRVGVVLGYGVGCTVWSREGVACYGVAYR